MKKLRVYQKKPVPLHSLLRHKCHNRSNRDVAQLVAHYVRDVGVASSNLVIPTLKTAETNCFSCLFFALYTTFSNFAVIEKQQFNITRDTKNGSVEKYWGFFLVS